MADFELLLTSIVTLKYATYNGTQAQFIRVRDAQGDQKNDH